MNAKEKALELVDQFEPHSDPCYHECSESWELQKSILDNAKQCAIIAVDEIMKAIEPIFIIAQRKSKMIMSNLDYWQQVKTEIEKL